MVGGRKGGMVRGWNGKRVECREIGSVRCWRRENLEAIEG